MNTAEIIKAAEIGTITVIDLRDASELHSSGQATGALHIPLADLVSKADPSNPNYDRRISKDRPIAVYGAAGKRAEIAVKLLGAFGYTALDIGGFYVWAAAGGPVSHYS
jgi:rhodanese-related sulfurtransferase